MAAIYGSVEQFEPLSAVSSSRMGVTCVRLSSGEDGLGEGSRWYGPSTSAVTRHPGQALAPDVRLRSDYRSQPG